MLLLLAAVAASADLTGIVVDASTGDPVAGANVRAGALATVTDAGGRFRLAADAAALDDSLSVSHVGYRAVRLATATDLRIQLQPLTLRLDEVVVRAGLTPESLQQSSSAVSVVGARRLAQHDHLQELATAIPNLNWAGGTSRPQYFQIRGIGERSHYAGEGPPSFSVGTVVDDVDLSGLGTGGLLFDLEQVEVYRGPQSTIFGANAMAGLIHVRSATPDAHLDYSVRTGAGSDGLWRGEGYVNLPVTPDLALRAGAAHGRSDGFRDNRFLDRQDTNRRRESVGRVKALWTPGPARVTGTLFVADADNGYDAWAPDNNEELVTYSDRPGVDAQRTSGLSLRADVPVTRELHVLSITSWSTTDSEYSFDGDWGNDPYWLAEPYNFDPDVENYSYSFFDDMERTRDGWTQELRLAREHLPGGGSAVIGAFARGLAESTEATGYLFGGDAFELDSRFDIDEVALYGQHRRPLSDRLLLTATLRADRNRTAYSGVTDGATRIAFDTSGWLGGGRLGLALALDERSALFANLARGYRAGGVNQHPRLAPENRPYEPEYVWNTELGWRYAGDAARLAVTAFHGRRSDQQVELSTQQDPGDPNSFVYFTSNAGAGWNAGVEVEGEATLLPWLGLRASGGWLRTHVDEYSFLTGQGERLILGDREAAHAPNFSLRAGLHTTAAQGAQASMEVVAVDAFYFSDSHDQRSAGYQLFNGSLGWREGPWSIRLWGRNLLDERYAVRGFYFGLEPPAYPETLYVSWGDPRQVGVTLTAHLAAL